MSFTYNVQADGVDFSVVIRIVDSTDGTPETGVVAATSGLALEYRRELATSTPLTESDLAALTTAHADGGMKHIGNGYYRVDLPDAAIAAGVKGCLVHGTVTGMIVIGAYIHITAYNPFNGSSLGLTNLDATISSRATPTQVNAEVVDCLNVDTYTEPGVGAPPVSATFVQKIGYLYKAWRNRHTQSTTTMTLFNDDTSTAAQTASVSDNGTVFDRGEIS
jgi:hypothetical protein